MGRPLLGHVIAGHAMHAALVERIMSDASLYEEVATLDRVAWRVAEALMA